MDPQLQEWNQLFLNYGQQKPRYDDWLEKYQSYLKTSKETPIIDLGCGSGNDTIYLTEQDYHVISCDYSIEALNRLKYFIKEPDTRLFDMLNGLPFQLNSAKIIIADLSIHYFSWADTKKIVHEISGVLVRDGFFFCRVNSVKDTNYGAGQGIMIEDNYYNIDGKFKRFFNEEQIRKLFENWEILYMNEYEMTRFKEPKIVWEIALKSMKRN